MFEKLKLGRKNRSLEKRREILSEKIANCERYSPNYSAGLDSIQVEGRINDGLINKKKKVVTKSYFKIFCDNFFTFFNILIYGLGILVAVAQKYNQLMFLLVITINTVLGIVQDVRARRLVDKLSIVNKMESEVIRGGTSKTVLATELVLDDIIHLKNGEQVPADCVVVNGKCQVNEAMLTGEPDSIKKKTGDVILSGTYISSGECYARVDKIGILNSAEEIQEKAKILNKPKSEILRSLSACFFIIGIIVIILGGLTLLSYFYANDWNMSWQKFAYNEIDPTLQNDTYVGSFAGTLVAMIPAGLYLLTSIALSVGVINLAKKRCLVQELYSIEMLARIDTLCLDKTGTITDGTMVFNKYIGLDKKHNEEFIGRVLKTLIVATGDDSYTTQAIKNRFNNAQILNYNNAVPFSSESKCSAVSIDKYGTYVMGAYGYFKLENGQEIKKIVNEYAKQGFRCLVVANTKKKILGDKIPDKLVGVGVVVLEDHIRDNAYDTLTWFAKNGVNIKVISGDDPVTVSEIAAKAGIENSNMYINLQGMSLDEVKNVANKYTVFGRVSPEQKEALVEALKFEGHTVGMTGDGVNDILALKRADCSIAMNSGSDAAKNVSHLVLLDSDFGVLPSVVSEGRRVINNLQRTSALFFSKTIFTMLLSLLSIIMMFTLKNKDMKFPLQTNNFYIWETAVIGIGGFFLSLEPNSSEIKGNFMDNALKRALPIAISLFIVTGGFFALYLIDKGMGEHVIFGVGLEVETIKTYQALCSIAMAVIGFASFYVICKPFDKYRKFVFVGILILTFGATAVCFNIPMKNYSSFGEMYFAFSFANCSLMDYIWGALFIESGIVIYFFLIKLFNKSKFLSKLDSFTKRIDMRK